MKATLLLLAGGASSRMGRSKAWLPVDGTTLIEWIARRLAPGFDEVLVCAAAAAQVPEALAGRLVLDRRPGTGPLVGLEAGLEATSGGVAFALACDMPRVNGAAAARIVAALGRRDAAVPRVGGRPEPLCAAYRREAGAAISAALDRGERRAAAPLAELDVAWIDDLEPAMLASLNTPADHRAFLDALRYAG